MWSEKFCCTTTRYIAKSLYNADICYMLLTLMLLLLYVMHVGAIIAGLDESDTKSAQTTVRGRDFNLCDPVSRQALIAWLQHLLDKMLCDDTVYSVDSDKLIDQDLKTANANAYTTNKQLLIGRLSKMITFVRNDVPKVVARKQKPSYGSGDIGNEASWFTVNDVVLMSAFLKCKCLCFNHYAHFDTNRPSRVPGQQLKWYQAVALGNGEYVGDYTLKIFTLGDIHDLLRDPRFCNLSGS